MALKSDKKNELLNAGKTTLKHLKNKLKSPTRAWPGPGLARAQVGPEQTFKNYKNRFKRGPGGSVWAETLSK